MKSYTEFINEQKQSKVAGFVGNIESLTIKNNNFRKVLYTAKHSQLVLMSLKSNEEIGEEIHKVDQFFRVEQGEGEVIIYDKTTKISNGTSIVIPAGSKHNVINTSNNPLKLYSIYSPPHHKDGTIHKTKQDAMKDKEHFDGKTSE